MVHFSLAGGLVDPPQEIVRQFLDGRLPESHHSTALRVHRAKDVVDRPVLASRVHSLQARSAREHCPSA